MPDETKPADGGGVMTAVWRWAIVVSLMGMAFTGGVLRASYETRIDHLETIVRDYAPGVAARETRFDRLEGSVAAITADVASLQQAITRLERAIDRIDARADAQSDRGAPK